MSETKTQLITVIGQRRSGLHAVVNWLIGLHQNRVRYINDPVDHLPLKPESFQVYYDYDVNPQAIHLRPTPHLIKCKARSLNWSVAVNLPWPWNGIARRILKKYWEPLVENKVIHLPTADGSDDLIPETHILLFENIAPERAAEVLPDWLASYRQFHELPPADRENLFIVARSPWNCLASTIKRPMTIPPRPVMPENVEALWTSYAKEIAGETKQFTSDYWEIQPLVYDLWIAQSAIRAEMAQKLGCNPHDLGISSTSLHGGGSSFTDRNPIPSTIDELTNRWRQLQQHPLMQSMLSSPEIKRLAPKLGLRMPDA